MNILEVENLGKTYSGGHQALDHVNLGVKKSEIFALLGPNGAGKTTLISIICGLVTPSVGRARVAGFDTQSAYKKTRSMIGLVPQELAADGFETVFNAVRYSRALFGRAKDDALLEQILSDLALSDKRDVPVVQLSGGMKRRVLIAKALSHEPELLFLDEPTAGVDVSLRKDLWAMVRRLRDRGTTIVLTTHYIDEAEELADRIGIINNGRLDLIEDKQSLMQRLGQKEIVLHFAEPITQIPTELAGQDVSLRDGRLVFHYAVLGERIGLTKLLQTLSAAGHSVVDVDAHETSLEEIFVNLVGEQ